MNWKIRRQTFSWETTTNDIEVRKLREVNEPSFEIGPIAKDRPWSRAMGQALRELEKEEGLYEYKEKEEGRIIVKRVEKSGYFSFKFNPQLTEGSEQEVDEGHQTATQEKESEA